MPSKRTLGQRLGLELYELIALHSPLDRLLEGNARLVSQILLNNLVGVLETVLLPAVGTNNLVVSVVVRDALSRHLAIAANDFSHDAQPKQIDSGKSV